MRYTRLERQTQWLAWTDEMTLPDQLVEHTRPQLFGERRMRMGSGEKISHTDVVSRMWLFTNHVGTGRRFEAKQFRRQRGI